MLSSGYPLVALGGKPEIMLVPIAAGLVAGLLLARHEYNNSWSLPVLAAFCAINLAQLEMSTGVSLRSILGFVLRLFVAYGFCRLGRDIPRAVVNAMTVLATIAIVIFSMQIACNAFGIDLADAMAPMSFDDGTRGRLYTVFHNFNDKLNRLRNAGIFWEPGAFAGYCSLALILLALIRHSLTLQQYRRRLLILVTAIVTSQSTTGILVTPLVLLLHLAATTKPRRNLAPIIAVWLIGAAAIGLLGYWALTAPVVREKIAAQVAMAVNAQGNWQLNRIGTMISDLSDLMQRPWFGWGANPLIRPSLVHADPSVQAGQGNGLSNFLARFGIIGMLIYLCAAAHGLMIATNRGVFLASVSVVLLCVILIGENFLNFPLFLAIMFLGARHGGTTAVKIEFDEVPVDSQLTAFR